MNSRNPLFVYIPVLLAMVFWSFSFIWYKQVFVYYRPVTVIVLRLVIAVPLAFLIIAGCRKLQRIQRIHLKWFILLGFFEPFFYFMGECYGVNLISPTLGAIIISLIPLLAPIPAWYLFREKFSLSNYVGLFISLAGLYWWLRVMRTAKPAAIAGVLLMLLAVVSAVCHSIFVRKLSDYYGSFTIVTYQSTFGLLYFIPVFAFTDFHAIYSSDSYFCIASAGNQTGCFCIHVGLSFVCIFHKKHRNGQDQCICKSDPGFYGHFVILYNS